MAGAPLFRDVSFKLERRDRMTLAGRNGAGKTTLLRMLAGETGIDGGELVLAKGTRPALHDQRPPRERDALAARLRALGMRRPGGARAGAGRARGRDGRAPRRRGPARPLRQGPGAAGARRRLGLAGARARAAPRPGLRRRRPRPPARRLLGRGAHPRVARARARGRPRPAAPRRAHQPPRHRLARVARGLSRGPRRRRRARGSRPLVPRGGGHLGAGAGGGPLALLPRLVARVAPGGGGARAAARPRDRQAAGGDRADGALHRALPRQGDEGAPGAVAREGDRAHGDASTRDPRDTRSLGFAFGAAERSGRVALEVEGARLEVGGPHAARGRRPVAGARRARVAGGPQRRRQDHADRGDRRQPRARRRPGAARPQREARLPHPALVGARLHRHRARGGPARHRALARARRARCSAASCSPAGRPRSRSTGCREASADGSRWRSSWPRTPTC